MDDLADIERQVLEEIRRYPQGAPQDKVGEQLNMTAGELVKAINQLSSKGMIEFYNHKNVIHLREVKPAEVLKLRQLTADERMLYQFIKQAGNTGIWTKDLRSKSGMQQATVTKTLKGLEARQIVKSVKSVESKTKKLYMLFELEPSRSITGGALYSEQEFDEAFTAALTEASFKFIQTRTQPKDRDSVYLSYENFPMAEDVHTNIQNMGLSKVDLSIEEIQTILNVLIYDGKIERTPAGSYRAIRPRPTTNHLTNIPCGTCPVFSFCTDSGPINPNNCEYLKEWMSKPTVGAFSS